MKKFVCILIVMCGYTNAFGEDWPQWRGVNRDGVLDKTPLLEKFPSDELERLWTVPLGAGYSGPTVADGRVYVTDRGPLDVEKEIERVLCFDAADGSLIWEHTYDAPYTISYRAGPRATVTVHQGRAIAVGAMGHMKCHSKMTCPFHLITCHHFLFVFN